MKGADSDVLYGNLLTVPLDDGFLYVEPVYVQGRKSAYPLLKKVAVSYGTETAFADSLSEGLNQVFGAGSSTEPPGEDQDEGEPTKPPKASDPTVQAALDDAQTAFEDGEKALKDGDWKKYGEAQERLQEALQRAEKASAKAAEKDGDKAGDKNADKDADKNSDKDGDKNSG
jgi:uncharacterized membrane protein (UPF0182 family)